MLTNAPLVTDEPVDIGVRAFCENCGECAQACPVDAIPEDRIIVEGVERWAAKRVECVHNVIYNKDGCRACVTACLLSKEPGLLDN